MSSLDISLLCRMNKSRSMLSLKLEEREQRVLGQKVASLLKKQSATKREAESRTNQEEADSQQMLNQPKEEADKRTNKQTATKIKMVSLTIMILNTMIITTLKMVIISMTKSPSIAMMSSTTDIHLSNTMII